MSIFFFFLLKLIIWNIDIHTCLLDTTFLCPHLYNSSNTLIPYKIISPKVLVTKGIYSRRFNFRDKWDRRGRMVQNVDEFKISIRARCTTLCDKVCHWLATGRWFSPNPPVSPTNKTDRHDITKLLLKVALNIITLAVTQRIWNSMHNS